MAESYRGLTVRIGADTSSLQKAMRGINSAVSATQGQLMRLQRALNGLGESGNATAQARQLELVGYAAQEVATKLATLRRAYTEVGGQQFQAGSITGTMAEVSAQMGDAAARAGQLRDQLGAVHNELASTYDIIAHSADTLGANLADDKIKGSVEAINAALAKTGQEYREFTEKTVNADAVVDEFARLGLITEDMAQHIHTLRDRYNDLNSEMKEVKQVQAFQDTQTEIAKQEVELDKLISKYRELQSMSTVGRSLSTPSQELNIMADAADNAAARFRELDAASRLDPSNVALAEERTQALNEATSLASQKADMLAAKLKSYSDAGISTAGKDTESLALELEQAEAKANHFASALQELEGEAQSLENEIAQIEAKDLGIGPDADKAKADVQALKDELSDVNDEIDNIKPSAQAAFDALDTSRARSEMRQTSDEMHKARAAAEGLGKETKSGFGDGVSVIIDISQYARQAAGYIVRASEEIDGAYRDMRKTVNGTEADFEHLRQAAMDYSQTHFTSADTILEMEAMGGQLGIATDKLEQFATTASNLDIATNIDADTIAQQMGQLANIMDDLNEDNLDSYADALVRLGNNMPALESDIAEVSTRIAAQGNIIGLTTPEVLGWATALSSTGMKAESAGTAFSKTISQIEAAVGGGTTAIADLAEATDQSVDDVLRIVSEGGPAFEDLAAAAGTSTDEIAASMENGKGKLEDFARVARMSAEDFARMWRESPSDALKAFIEGLKAVQDAGGSMDNTLAELGITATRQKQGLEGLTQTTDKLNDALEMSGDAWNGVSDQWGDAGDAAREADRKSEGFSGTLQELSNNAQVLAASFGEGMVPLMEGAIGIVSGLADAFQAMPPAVSTTVASFGALATGISLVYPVIRGLNHSWGEFTGMLTSLPGVNSAVGGLGKLKTVIGEVTGLGSMAAPVLGGIAAAIGYVGIAAYDEWQKQEQFNNSLKNVVDVANNAAYTLNGASSSFDSIGHAAETSMEEIRAFADELGQHANKIKDNLDKTGTSVKTLEEAQRTISELYGNSKLNAEDYGRLNTALETVNSTLGTQTTAADIMAGKWRDQRGAVHDLKEELEQLIQKKQDEMRVDAYSDAATTAFKDKIEAQKKLSEQEKKVFETEREMDEWRSRIGKNGFYPSQEEVDERQKNLDDERNKLEELKPTVESTSKAYESYAALLGDAQKATSEFSTELQRALVFDEDGKFGALGETIRSNGESVADFARQLEYLGVTEDGLKSLDPDQLYALASAYDGTMPSIVEALNGMGIGWQLVDANTAQAQMDFDNFVNSFRALPEESQSAFNDMSGGIENFMTECEKANVSIQNLTNGNISADQLIKWAEDCNWNIEDVIAEVQKYNETHMEPQTAEVETETALTAVDFLQGGLKKMDGKTYSATVNAHATGAGEVKNTYDRVVDFGKLPPSTEKKAEAKANGQDLVDKLREAFEKYSQVEELTKTATGEANGTGDVQGLYDVVTSFDALSGNVTKVRTMITRNVTESAAGGIRMHADGGYIATGPTFMTPRDMVGEAGAEAIVPLTNRRYSGAFARVIAEEIGKLGTQSVGNVFNVTLNAYGNDNPERFARQSMRSMMQLARAEG